MGKMLTEKQVLKKLGIKNFRHMSKDNIVAFASNLSEMDPKVAIVAIQQFPNFASNVKEVMVLYKDIVNKTIDSDSEDMKSFNQACDMLIKQLNILLDKDQLTFEEKGIVMDRIMEVLKLKMQMKVQRQNFLKAIFNTVSVVIVTVVVVVASVFGIKVNVKR